MGGGEAEGEVVLGWPANGLGLVAGGGDMDVDLALSSVGALVLEAVADTGSGVVASS